MNSITHNIQTGEVKLLIPNKHSRIIGKIINTPDESNIFLTERLSKVHIMRKFQAFCFNMSILSLDISSIRIIVDGNMIYSIDISTLQEFMDYFDNSYYNGDELQLMIPLQLFNTRNIRTMEIKTKIEPDRFHRIMNNNWFIRQKNLQQEVLFD